jgi:hypothetical protein
MDKSLSDAVAVANEAGLTDRDLAAVVEAATVRQAEAQRSGLVAMTRPGLPPIHVAAEAVEYYESLGAQRVPDTDPELAVGDLPKGNASRDDWAAYALAHGMTEEDLAPPDREQLSRDEIRDHFQPDEEN